MSALFEEIKKITAQHCEIMGYESAAAQVAPNASDRKNGIGQAVTTAELALSADLISLAELVQDRANELLTWHDQQVTVLRIANELYDLTTKLLR